MTKVTIQEYAISEFRGDFPEIPTAEGVDLDALRAQDSDLMMVSLPIIPKIGATSRNGLLYDDALADSIVQQINSKRPEAIFGHLKDEERSTAYPEPAAIWVGAKKDGNQVWAKAVITDPTAKNRIRRLKATGGQIATSIYGKGAYEPTATKGVRRLASFDLESLDFAPPARAALQNGAHPVITAETTQENPDMDKQTIIAELTVGDIPASLRDQIIAEAGQRNSQATRIAELQQQVEDTTALLTTAQETIAEFQRAKFEAGIDSRVAELTNWQVRGEEAQKKLAAFRRTLKARIVAELGDDRDETTVAETVQTVWTDLEPLAETLRDGLAGPAAVIGGKGRSVTDRAAWRDELVAKAGQLRAQYGI
jgi:hypothetical protein